MTYLELLEFLLLHAEEEFAAFQRKIISTERKIMGIRTPVMRKLAKSITIPFESLLAFPNEYYEVVFIKLTVLSSLPYEEFLSYLYDGLSLIDNWALCDCFKVRCIKKHKTEFLPVLNAVFLSGKEYFQRYVLVTLLFEYMNEEYIPLICNYLQRANHSFYYVHMAAAWLTAEVLIKRYEAGIELLQSGILPAKTHDKGIQKAIESYRLTKNQKEYLRSMKINQKR